MNSLLKPLELAYRAVAGLRRGLYRRGTLRPRRLPRPVISVGNIAFGGTGKTPTVIAIAVQMVRAGARVAVLSRGYGRRSHEMAVVAGQDPDRYGDEPVLISRAVPQAVVAVGADRFQLGNLVLRERECDVFLLDDGFQHLPLHRDLDVVIDDRGAALLRESRSALSDADIVLVRNGSGEFTLQLQPSAVVIDGQQRSPESLRGARLLVFSALAENEQFFEVCRSLGADLVGTRSFPDHHRYSSSEIERLRAEARRSGAMLLTTEKDQVKTASGIAALRVEARIHPREAFFERIMRVLEKR